MVHAKSFGSDNHAGVHPEVMAAVVAANDGDTLPYGSDPWTADMENAVREVFGEQARGYAMFNGTGANVVGLGLMLRPYDGVICPASAHINGNEAGAAERVLGTKLLTVATEDGKLRPGDVLAQLGAVGNEHLSQPRVVSISQVTECGTVYTPEEIAALAEVVHEKGLFLHMDGARLANAAAELGCGLADITTAVGVDVLSYGATKNGALGAEALIVLRPELAPGALFLRKQGMQLASKMRYVAPQITALLRGDLWLRNAAHANAMAHRLADGVASAVKFRYEVQSNAVFPVLPEKAIVYLMERFTFGHWDRAGGVVRWVTAFDTTEDDVDALIAATHEALSFT
ncbi:threonine aldolase family protein [Herbidospora cretacea]|uniref:threonine aldolase family protein n=1 Tax=Herbidospora cretacea TaxID=28444 RepID=UPI0004C44074|nr:aminotransferase class I/II-fold pyridoxal phosphate-dependent enzyme [Herbidospora cretacea]